MIKTEKKKTDIRGTYETWCWTGCVAFSPLLYFEVNSKGVSKGWRRRSEDYWVETCALRRMKRTNSKRAVMVMLRWATTMSFRKHINERETEMNNNSGKYFGVDMEVRSWDSMVMRWEKSMKSLEKEPKEHLLKELKIKGQRNWESKKTGQVWTSCEIEQKRKKDI